MTYLWYTNYTGYFKPGDFILQTRIVKDMLSIKVEPEDMPTREERRIIQEEFTNCSENTGINDGTLQVTVQMEDDDDLRENSENGIAVVIKMKDSDHADEGTSRKRALGQKEEAKKKDAAEARAKCIEKDVHVINSTVTTLSDFPETVHSEIHSNRNVARKSALQTVEASTTENVVDSVTEPSQEVILPEPLLPTLPVRGTDAEMTQAQVSSLQDERPKETYPGLLQNTILSEDAHRPVARSFAEEFASVMKSLLDRFEYERGQENRTLKRVYQDLTEKLIQENISLRREVEDVKKQLHHLENKLAVTRQTSDTEEDLLEKVHAGIITSHAKAPVKSPRKSRPHTTSVEDRCSSQSQQGAVELLPGSGVHVTQAQMNMLELRAATKNAQQLLRIGLLMVFTKDELMNGCAVGTRMAHNKGTPIPSTPLDPVKLMTLKAFVLKKFKRKDKRPALQDKEMNRIINCKCSELRRFAANN